MAVVSDAMYNARTAAVSYVSSSAYYGYVPPCRRENQLAEIIEGAGAGGTPAFPGRVHDSAAMDTDDDGYDYSAASRRLNNNCLIPEASPRCRLEVDERLNQQHDQHHRQQQQQQQQAVSEADTLMRRRNRKRCYGDLGPAREHKKLREEAVVTAAFTMVQEVQRTMDWPLCIMRRHHCT